jgi:cell wall-associated NlpC family hydrolase
MIPFGRELRLGNAGPDVKAVKRALARAGFGPKKLAGLTQTFGSYAVTNLRHFQTANKLDVDGVYGSATHKKLAPHFDALAAQWYANYKPTRHRIVDAAHYFVGIEPRVSYTQGPHRMMIVRQRLRPPIPAGVQVYEDCSSFVTGCFWIGGAPDPNGRGYDGQGYTGTLAQHGRPVSIREARPADLILYGRSPFHHVTLHIGNGLCISHGSERGPVVETIDYRGDRAEIRSYLA